MPDQPLQPDLAMRYGLYDARGYDYPVERRYDTLWRAAGRRRGRDFDRQPTQPRAARRPPAPAHAQPAQRDRPAAEPARRAAAALAGPARSPTAGPDARVYRNDGALPRAFLVGAPAHGRRRRRGARRGDRPGASTPGGWRSPRTRVAGLPQDERRPRRGRRRGSGAPGQLRARARGRPRRRPRRSLLVLTDVHYPGWKATVDGREAPIERVDYLLRGVPCPPGEHTVELRYEPASWRVGWIVSVALARRWPSPPSAARRSADARREGAGATAARGPALRRRPALARRRCSTPSWRCSSSAPRCCPARRCRTRTRCGSSRRGCASKPAELTAPSNPELGDAPEQLQLFLHHTGRGFPDVAAVEPLHRRRAGRSRPTRSRRSSGPTACPPTCCRSGRRWAGSACSSCGSPRFGTFLLGPRAGHALRRRAAGRHRLRAQPEDGHVALVSAHERVDASCPWLLLLTDRLVRRPNLLAGAGLAAVVGLQFLAGPRRVELPRPAGRGRLRRAARCGRRAARRAPWAAAAAGLRRGASRGGAALAAVSLIPLRRARCGCRPTCATARASRSTWRWRRKEALGLFLPDYWGRPTQTPIRPLPARARAATSGALPLMLAAAALVLRPRRTRVAVAAFGVAVVRGRPRRPAVPAGRHPAAGVQLGPQHPPDRADRCFALALLAGWGLDDADRRASARRRTRRAVLGVAAALLRDPGRRASPPRGARRSAPCGEALEVAWLFADPPGRLPQRRIGEDVIRLSSLIIWLTLAGAGTRCCWRCGSRGRLAPAPFAALAVLLVCVDLFRAGMGFNPAIDQRRRRACPRRGAIRFLERQRPGALREHRGDRPERHPFEFGLYEARGYDLPIVAPLRPAVAPRDRRPAARVARPGCSTSRCGCARSRRAALRTLRLLGVTPRAAREGGRSPTRRPSSRSSRTRRCDAPGLTLVYDGAGRARVPRRRARCRARSWSARQRVVADDDAALDAVTRPGFDARRGGGHRGARARAARRAAARPAAAPRIIDLRGRARGRPRPRAAPGPARARATRTSRAGRRRSTGARADRAGRTTSSAACGSGPGAHTVEFRYEPLSWRIGWISAAGVLALAVGRGGPCGRG